MLTTCSACGATNRIPAKHLADVGRCGSCKAPLPPLSSPIEANAELFQEIIQSAKVPVLVGTFSHWCGPCKMAAPEVAAVAKEMAGKLIVLKVDTEQEERLAAQYRVQGIPNFMVFRNGQAVQQRAGLMPRAQLRSWIEQPA